ncbi:hypothetical protein LRD69_01465 [Streptomyces sp. JH14]|uniref:hypothetical protein n=1 Tax=Streptomyces sp. JH14 TaxID=2793630 RepID=UPI0023F9E1F8|nr:hypothetical protein [Streptomyces sp. JH14]MDF6040857.1 hypothetical protein [Streptomyces sp. JH14]
MTMSAQGQAVRDVVSLMHAGEGLIVHHATRDLLDESARLHRSTAERTCSPAPCMSSAAR